MFMHLRFAYLFQSEKHVMTKDDWLVLDFGSVAVFSSKHIDFPLVNTQLADVRIQKEDISALHERVEDLSRG